ncbi:sensor histidine kinase [Paenibacillus rigui]|uniref:Two-component sensor histidine kinase n=1 Tax=Paenibacillus rigui TaxID=554312 RepID=A0A229UTB1_9BACL|nr:sensor histidine kinase [Paenibacillus rigui]OXM86756.1 two-component sensor histidine kinase [Paenibacillus rigui]
MFRGWNTFNKTVLLILIVLLPIAFIFSYTNQISVQVIEKELQEKALKHLSFFGSQIDNTVNQLSVNAIVLSRDPGIKRVGNIGTGPGSYERLQEQEDFIQKISLLSAASNWTNRLTIYYPQIQQAVSSDYYSVYNESYLDEMSNQPVGSWIYHAGRKGDSYFAKFLWSPFLINQKPKDAETVVEARFPESNLITMLRDYSSAENGNSIFYKQGNAPIYDPETNSELTNKINAALDKEPPDQNGYRIINIDDESYTVDYVRLESLGWYAVSYFPLEQVLLPIKKSRDLFYTSISLMLLIGLLAAVFLYRQVQLPIRKLLRGIEKIQTGTYSYRIRHMPKNEFDYLFIKFNQMSSEIQRLVKKVYEENIRYRDAQLKHLQAQINPHFLSNSLFFVKNMIAVDDKDAATRMILNLASYYRYVTKLEHTMTSLQEELELIDNYLVIQNLRLKRFHYEIHIPESMRGLQIPRLLIQPIVENTVIHSIEKSGRYGIIDITGELIGEEYVITIDDNGKEISEETIRKLQLKVERDVKDGEGFGLWNVHQRLRYHFGQEAGLQFTHSQLGGLRVAIRWTVSGSRKMEGSEGDQ